MGVVSCGGESRRMGRDKGLILQGGVCWARRMADKLELFGLPVVFSVNPSQLGAYAAALPGARLVVDAVVAAPGPLGGLLSVYEQFPDKDLLLLACDMIDMDHGTIAALVDVRAAGGDHDFYVYREGDFFQPFCSIYTSAGLAAPHTAVLQGGLRVPSLQQLLREGKTKSLTVERGEAFRNYNTL
jgi:molybdopterin-guanine dinucleotide biosynthesis protein A